MDIRPVDVRDEPALRTWHRARMLAHEHDRPHAPFWSAEEMVRVISTDDPEERFLPFVCEVGGEAVGAALVFVPLLDNLDKAYFELEVAPAHRGHGVGDALLSQVLAAGADEGRKLLIGLAHLPYDADTGHPIHRFADRHGFAVGNTEVRRSLRLPVPDATLQAWVDEAGPYHHGYEIETYVDWVPVELRPSFVQLLNLLAVDAPTGDIDFEAGGMTVEVYEQQTRTRVGTGRKTVTTVAVKDGETVAHSTLSVPPPDTAMPHLNQWGTLVRADHRGHRLGLAVKAANLRAAQEMHPERTLIHTSNSPVNGPMVAINEKMGFRPVEVNVEFVHRL